MADISFPVYGEVYAKNGDKIAPNNLKVEQGWVQEMMPFQYENWLQNRQDVAITYLLQKGIPEYNAAQEYVANKSVVLYVGAVYLATVNGLLGLPSDTSQWRRLSVALDTNGVVPVASGGTGASTPSQARTNLGLGTASTLDADFVVQKDISGNFSAGVITATLAGNATTSSSWLSGRTISLSGAVKGMSSAWKGDGNLTITTTSLDATKLTGEVPSSSLPLVVKKTSNTGVAKLPRGTSAQRPSVGTEEFGDFRANESTGLLEYWNGAGWVSPSAFTSEYVLNRANHTGTQDLLTTTTGTLSVARGGTGGTTALSGFDNIKQDATESYKGVTSFSSSAENVTGTIENKAVDPLGIREAFNATGSAPVYACRAWVDFNGQTASPTIRGGGNISSVVKNSAGNFTINFLQVMPDIGYALSFSIGSSGATIGTGPRQLWVISKTTTSVRVLITDGPSGYDPEFTSIVIHR